MLRTDNEIVPGKYLFKYFYVCFVALKSGWLEGCSNIIVLIEDLQLVMDMA